MLLGALIMTYRRPLFRATCEGNIVHPFSDNKNLNPRGNQTQDLAIMSICGNRLTRAAILQILYLDNKLIAIARFLLCLLYSSEVNIECS